MPSNRARSAASNTRMYSVWKHLFSMTLLVGRLKDSGGPFARKVFSLSALTAAGQGLFVIALPLLTRQYTPADFGLFTVYLSIVNIGGPIVGLKYESALYTVRTKKEATHTLALSLLVVFVTCSTASVLLYVFREQLEVLLGPNASTFAYLLPIGLLLSGLWSISSAWAIKWEAVSTLAAARFAQPAAMTALQVAAGFVQPSSGIALIGAHLVSHLGYSTLIFARTVTWKDVNEIRSAIGGGLLRHAMSHRHFPMYLLPAQVSYLAVSNLPPLLLRQFTGQK